MRKKRKLGQPETPETAPAPETARAPHAVLAACGCAAECTVLACSLSCRRSARVAAQESDIIYDFTFPDVDDVVDVYY